MLKVCTPPSEISISVEHNFRLDNDEMPICHRARSNLSIPLNVCTADESYTTQTITGDDNDVIIALRDLNIVV